MHLLYGLRVDSEIDLPLPAVDGPCDVSIRIGPVEPRGDLNWSMERPFAMSCRRDGVRLILSWPDVRFSISREQIIVDAANVDLAAHLLLHVVWSLVLDERGQASLHGSAVEGDEGAIAILGPSGSGKSTAVLTMLDQGWRLVSDDLLAFVDDDRLLPGPPFVRLLEDRAAGRPGSTDVGGKLRYFPAASQHPARLAAIVVHGDQYGEPAQLLGSKALDALIREVYCFLPPQPGQTQRRFMLALNLIDHVPVFGVRPRSLTDAMLRRLTEEVTPHELSRS